MGCLNLNDNHRDSDLQRPIATNWLSFRGDLFPSLRGLSVRLVLDDPANKTIKRIPRQCQVERSFGQRAIPGGISWDWLFQRE
jgi:hypothetical protein